MAFWDFLSLFLLLLLLLIRLQLHTETKRSYILNHSFFKDFFSDFLIHDRFVWVCLRVAFATRVCGEKNTESKTAATRKNKPKLTHTESIQMIEVSVRVSINLFIIIFLIPMRGLRMISGDEMWCWICLFLAFFSFAI